MKISNITKSTLSSAAALLILGTAPAAFAGHHKEKSMATTTANIVGVAAGNENFETLVAAVKAADLVGALSSDGPFTVFAPIDDAFAKLPKGTVATLVKPENKGTLTDILTYHVVAGKFTAKDVMALLKKHGGKASVKTLQGNKLTIANGEDGSLILIDAKGMISKIIMADVGASNGVIHAIDSVVMPK